MSKKFSITKTIDLNKLNNEIDEYIMQTGETNLQLFMHIDTMNAIDRAYPVDFEPPCVVRSLGTIGTWEGNKIFIDNDLEFGEIEIRQGCEHKWNRVGSVAGTKARYEVYICSKCGKQQTRRISFNKEKNDYIVTILDLDED